MNDLYLNDNSLLDRVITPEHCRTGLLKDLKPSAFEWRKGEKGLSFSDREQISPSDAINRYNKNISWNYNKTGQWTAAISVEEAVYATGSSDRVYFDDPVTNPSHVLVAIPPNLKTKNQKREFRSILCYFAMSSGRELYT